MYVYIVYTFHTVVFSLQMQMNAQCLDLRFVRMVSAPIISHRTHAFVQVATTMITSVLNVWVSTLMFRYTVHKLRPLRIFC